MKIVALLGPSGVGKGWLKSCLIRKSNVDFFLPRIFTTRPSRKDDVANHKISITNSEFDSKVKDGDIAYPHKLLSNSTSYKYGFSLDDLNAYPSRNLLIELYPTILPDFKLKQRNNLLSIGLLANEHILESNLIKRGTETDFSLTAKMESAESEVRLLLEYYEKNYIDYLFSMENTEKNMISIVEKIVKSI